MNQIIQETKNYEGTTIKATDASGDICTMWNQTTWELIFQHKEMHWIKIEFINKTSGYQICHFNIYTPTHFRDKEHYRNYLANFLGHENNKKYIICGDLNLIFNIDKKRAGNFQVDPFRDKLENIMEAHNLTDILPKNGKYTWRKKAWPQKYQRDVGQIFNS